MPEQTTACISQTAGVHNKLQSTTTRPDTKKSAHLQRSRVCGRPRAPTRHSLAVVQLTSLHPADLRLTGCRDNQATPETTPRKAPAPPPSAQSHLAHQLKISAQCQRIAGVVDKIRGVMITSAIRILFHDGTGFFVGKIVHLQTHL